METKLIEALELIIKMQKDKIEQLEKEIQTKKLEPLKLTLEHTCHHEFEIKQDILGFSEKCKKCNYNKQYNQYTNPPQPFITITNCLHEYPNPWMATVPPNCKKCGQQAPSYTITSSSSGISTSGYMSQNQNYSNLSDFRQSK